MEAVIFDFNWQGMKYACNGPKHYQDSILWCTLVYCVLTQSPPPEQSIYQSL